MFNVLDHFTDENLPKPCLAEAYEQWNRKALYICCSCTMSKEMNTHLLIIKISKNEYTELFSQLFSPLMLIVSVIHSSQWTSTTCKADATLSAVNGTKMTCGAVLHEHPWEAVWCSLINSSAGHRISVNIKDMNHRSSRSDVRLCHTVIISNDREYGGSLSHYDISPNREEIRRLSPSRR